jgi:hypothetical protein
MLQRHEVPTLAQLSNATQSPPLSSL